jgi:hypothetical protein
MVSLFLLLRVKTQSWINGLGNRSSLTKVTRVTITGCYLADRGQLPCVRWECPGEGKRKKTTVRFELAAIRAFIEPHRKNG